MKASSSLYSTAVEKLPAPSSIPDEAVSKPHHVLSGQKIKGFKNPYPSYSNPVNFSKLLTGAIWYVASVFIHITTPYAP